MHLDQFNAEPRESLRPTLLACADVPAWAQAVEDGRPYAEMAALEQTADTAARQFSPADVDRALAAHPRIGDQAQGQSTHAAWSRGEQSGVSQDEATQVALREGNQAYERRFGRVFLICAGGLTAEQILGSLQTRLTNDDDAEAAVVAEELRKIALLRLRKVIDT
ncbi:2-oxo-4-hydroxy-4-carboxy-5-ureidoimidazoline decarboxylase [Leekyejoonella antrihumi]|uniref:2-oxo-4-hydroxy-4-carboxy-5-ureidoimidazoline decarboxylase n=1 Tax=Leekyejoonella antrihumi TaxID=1660198 RepID=A0A563DYZ3_9MICO|nr:2-oxo-4-hydroxy-4-carboxy-5-ureidoimidazoline decarboxylase [Leekyejoonella antrihumi]TWP35447.1 2-oxo-4-hydroxy-4-carboxy-5-ureidoimidazoline decarboxylase [Leekyejoonella antrihumi]